MASGDSLAVFGPTDAILPSTNYPQFVVRNNHMVLAFDTTTQETCYLEFVLPKNYAGGGVTCYITHLAQSATSGTLGWGLSWERTFDTATDLDADSFASEILATPGTVSGTSGITTQVTIAFTNGAQMDSPTVGDTVRLRFRRDVANDTATGDGQWLALELRET